MRRTIDPKTAGWREILAFSLLPLGILTIDCTVYTVMDFYLTDVLKLSMGLASFVLLGTKAWDAVNDPLMGQLVERTRTKHGKCRPYLLWTPLPLALITALLFLPIPFPESWNLTDAQKRAYILADNQLALNAGWDEEMLSVELSDLQDASFDLSLLGFDDDELEKLAPWQPDVKAEIQRRHEAHQKAIFDAM